MGEKSLVENSDKMTCARVVRNNQSQALHRVRIEAIKALTDQSVTDQSVTDQSVD